MADTDGGGLGGHLDRFLDDREAVVHGSVCWCRRLARELDEPDRAHLVAILQNRGLNHGEVAEMLTEYWARIASDTPSHARTINPQNVGYHRRGKCRCINRGHRLDGDDPWKAGQ